MKVGQLVEHKQKDKYASVYDIVSRAINMSENGKKCLLMKMSTNLFKVKAIYSCTILKLGDLRDGFLTAAEAKICVLSFLIEEMLQVS